jgi:hypothetical protein
MLSKVRGTTTPREIRDPGLFIKESSFSPCGFGLLCKQDIRLGEHADKVRIQVK